MGTRDLTHKAIAEALSNDRLLTHDQRAALITLVADDSVWQRKHDETAAEVTRLVDKCNSYIADNARLAEEVDRLREELTREEAQYKDMQRDAERYRWLRLQDWDTSPLAVVANPRAAIKLGHDAPSRDRLDAMIDAHVAEVQGFLNHTLDGLALGPNVCYGAEPRPNLPTGG